MQAHRKQISAIKLTMNMAKHGAKGLNIFRSHRKNSYTTVSVSFFGLPAVQSSRDTRDYLLPSKSRFEPSVKCINFNCGAKSFHLKLGASHNTQYLSSIVKLKNFACWMTLKS